MSVEKIKELIESDVSTGGHQTFESVVGSIKDKSAAADDLFELANSDSVQVDVGIGGSRVYRLSLSEFERADGTSRDLSIWEVNEKGWPVSDMYTIISFPGKEGSATCIEGSSQGSLDGGDLIISPEQLAGILNAALATLEPHNWKLVVGSASTPEGET